MAPTKHISTLEDQIVVLIGCGRMGSALAGGLVASGQIAGDQLVCIDADPERAEALADELDARMVLPEEHEGARMWIIAVKPHDVEAAIDEHTGTLEAGDTVVSVAAGLSLAKLRKYAGHAPAVVRAMPNTPALVGKGVTGYMADADIDTTAVRELFESVGEAVELDREGLFDALTGVSGSGPAYIFTAIEALADGGVLMGLSREVSRKLAAQTVAGAAALVEADMSVHTAELKDRVASPGGTTICALATLEDHGFRRALIRAVEAAALRSREMGEDN